MPVVKNEKRINYLNDVNLNELLLRKRNNIKAHAVIEEFNQKFLQALINLKYTDVFFDYDYYLDKVAELSYLSEHNLHVETQRKLNQVIGSVGMSDVLLNQGIENKDLEVLTVGFTELFNDLKRLNVFENV